MTLCFQVPYVQRFFARVGLTGVAALAFAGLARGQACSIVPRNAVYIDFQSTRLNCQISGFYPYVINPGDTTSPPTKYASESWSGDANDNITYSGGGGAHYYYTYSGAWTFDKSDYGSNPAKAVSWTGFEYNTGRDLSGHSTGALESPIPSPATTTATQITWSDGHSDGAWYGGSFTQQLTNAFTADDAINRARNNPVLGLESLQTYTNYSPLNNDAARSPGVGQTDPVTFTIQTVKFRAQFSEDSCKGRWQITYYYYKWKTGDPQPTTPNYTEHDEVTFDNPPYFAPQSGYRSYPTAVQGENYQLAYVQGIKLCDAGQAGDSGKSHNSVDVYFSFGHRAGEQPAGVLGLHADAITSGLYVPLALDAALSTAPDIIVVRDANQAVRQVKAPECLADIETIDASTYEVRFYHANQVGAQDPATSLFALSGSPFVVYRIANPDAAGGTATNRLQITETRDSQSKVTIYTDNATSTAMSLNNGLLVDTLATTVSGSDTVRTRTISDSGNHVSSVTQETRHSFPWGQDVTQEIKDPSGAQLTTTYVYYTNASDTADYGLLQQRVDPSGHWETYTYDSAKRLTKTVAQFLDSSLGSADSSNRVTNVVYGSLADQDGDGVPETLVTTTQTLLGQEISRSYEVIYSQLGTADGQSVETRLEIQCTATGAAWNSGTNLVTKVRRFKGGDWNGYPVNQLNPDNTLTTNDYAFSPSAVTITSYTGASSNGTTVTAGTETITVKTLTGQMLSTNVYDYPSGLQLSSETTTQQDAFGRPAEIDYLDGTSELLSYACCGLDSDTDREGITTSYNYDDLGRATFTTRAGITQNNALDADGRVLSVTRIGTDSSQIITATNHYDLAGRLVWTKDALNRQTSFSEAIDGNGHTVKTTTYPDGGTRIETYFKDGSLLSVTGTAVVQKLGYNYGVDPGGAYTQEIHTGSNGESTEWIKTYTDIAGRNCKTVHPDGAAEQSFYNNLGQLVKQVDADGVATLFAYNAKGEQESTAIDIEQTGQIDFSGTDRITQTHRDVITDHGVTVQRTTTTVWTTDNSGNTQVISTVETTPEGRHTWQTTYGLTTQTQIVYGGSGARTETTTAPDGTVATRQFQNDLLMSATVSQTSIGQLSAINYAYDPHGRVQTTTDARTGATTYAYFADDQIQTVTTPPVLSSPNGQVTIYGYDSAGRQNQVTQPDGGIITTTYYPNGKAQNVSGARTYPVAYTYDAQGRMKTMTTWQDYTGNKGAAGTTWNYDLQRGWLLSKVYADRQGPGYTYYPSGRLKTRTWARGVTTTYAYNTAGDLAGTSYSDATPSVALTYDRLGRLFTTTDAAGLCTWAYDPVSGQVASESYSAGLLNGLSVGRHYDSLNRPDSTSVPSVPSVPSVFYHYDLTSRLHSVTSGNNTATYGYIPNSNLVGTLTLANGSTTDLTTKAYDNLNRLSAIDNAFNAQHSTFNYTYNNANQRTQAAREDGSYWNYGYDALGEVTSGQKFLSGGTPALGYNFGWTFDNIGNRRTTTRNALSSGAPAEEDYTPNNLNEYQSRTVPGKVDVLGTANATAYVVVNRQDAQRQGTSFYQAANVFNVNRPVWKSLEIVGVQNNAGPNGEDDVTTENRHAFVPPTPELFGYDADGNLTADGRWNYTWDAENRLVSMQIQPSAASAGAPYVLLQFAYDAQGRRIDKKVSAWNPSTSSFQPSTETKFLYDGWNMLAEFSSSAIQSFSLLRSYIWGLDLSGSLHGAGGVGGLLFEALNLESGTLNCSPAYDGNGNIINLINVADGSDAADFEYDPFGNVLKATGVALNAQPFGFSTKYTDVETSLLYYGQRYYNPGTGRWLSRDPIEEQGGANMYGFVGNNPIGRSDYLGLEITGPASFLALDKHYPDSATQTYTESNGNACWQASGHIAIKGSSQGSSVQVYATSESSSIGDSILTAGKDSYRVTVIRPKTVTRFAFAGTPVQAWAGVFEAGVHFGEQIKDQLSRPLAGAPVHEIVVVTGSYSFVSTPIQTNPNTFLTGSNGQFYDVWAAAFWLNTGWISVRQDIVVGNWWAQFSGTVSASPSFSGNLESTFN